MPDIAADAALMKMEVGGICGTDVKLYQHPPTRDPVIMGHENIGIIAKAGREFTNRKGFKEGDLVFVEHYVMLRQMRVVHAASTGIVRTPTGAPTRRPSDMATRRPKKPPHLYGGFAQYVYLPWNSVLHHVPKGVSAGACRPGDADGKRSGVVAVRRRRRL